MNAIVQAITGGKTFEEPFINLAFVHLMTLHGFGGVEMKECALAASKIDEQDALGSWTAAWDELAQATEAHAKQAEANGRRVSARSAYLRAVSYYRAKTFGLRPSPEYRQAIEHYRELFCKFAALSDTPIEVVKIPYNGKMLPGYFLKPDNASAKRPTVIIGDNVSEELYYWVGPPAIARGYNALLVDLPGIGLNPYNDLPFEPALEKPVGAVLDYLLARPDVDSERIVVYGGGESGGYIMARAASGEHRIAACIVDPIVTDMSIIGPLTFQNVFHASDDQNKLGSVYADLMKFTWNIPSADKADAIFKSMQVNAASITCPMLCMNDAGDSPELQRQAQVALQLQRNPKSSQHLFGAREASFYRELDNFGLKHQVMFDWFDEQLKR